MRRLTDWDAQVQCFDFETSGTKPEYALQPWRIRKHEFWATSLVWMRCDPEIKAFGGLAPDKGMMREMLEEAVARKLIMLGWYTVFDISVLLAYGLHDLVFKLQWMDGSFIWKEYYLEPEYETARHKKKSYGLKSCVEEYLPQYAGYAEDVDFHDPSPEARRKLHHYNVRDVGFTWAVSKHLWEKLTDQQRMATQIKAECLPLVAQANLEGMPIDRLAMRELAQQLENTANERLAVLAEHGVTEKVVRSPLQLSKLMFDEWKLPVLKSKTNEKVNKKTGEKVTTISRSTDKEVLHELSFKDPRAKQLSEYREALNNSKKFAQRPIEAADYNGDDCAHPLAIPFGTYCVQGDVEVLTRQGWVRLDQWKGGEIMQAHPCRTMEFLPADLFEGPEVDQWVHVKQRGVDIKFTLGHTVPYLAQKTLRWRTIQAHELLEGEQRGLPVAGYAKLGGRFTVDQMRLFAAIQADGYLIGKYLKFTFKKERKIRRIKLLLDALGIRYREYVCAAYPDRTEIVVAKSYRPDWITKDKKVLGPWLLDTDRAGLQAFVRELQYWDGSRHKDGGVKYTSSIRSNVEWAATAASLVGIKASVHADNCCHISAGNPWRSCRPRYVSKIVERAQTFCPKTMTGFWLARSNGHILITGNTGRMTYSSKQKKNAKKKDIMENADGGDN